jgi:hypothetical protein
VSLGIVLSGETSSVSSLRKHGIMTGLRSLRLYEVLNARK